MVDVVVVVDPYSSGRYLVEELNEHGYSVVGIQSSTSLPDSWTKQVQWSWSDSDSDIDGVRDPRFVDFYVHGGDVPDVILGSPAS